MRFQVGSLAPRTTSAAKVYLVLLAEVDLIIPAPTREAHSRRSAPFKPRIELSIEWFPAPVSFDFPGGLMQVAAHALLGTAVSNNLQMAKINNCRITL